MTLTKSTRVWIALFVAALVANAVLDRAAPASGCWGFLAKAVAAQAAIILLWRGGMAAFRHVMRRLTLRLAFSYLLIGVVPIPLLAALLGIAAYVVANQYVANRLRREFTAVGEGAVASGTKLPEITIGSAETVTASSVDWLPVGSPAPCQQP